MNYYGYLRVSTDHQNNEKFMLIMTDYSKQHGFKYRKVISEVISGSKYWQSRKIGKLLLNLCKPGDVIITPELSRLGRSMLDIMEIASYSLRNEINIYSIKNDFTIKNDIMSKILLSSFSLASEIEKELLRSRIQEALDNLKAKGIKLGPPEIPHSKTLNNYKFLIDLQQQGFDYSNIARLSGLSYNEVYYILNRKKHWRVKGDIVL